MAEGSNGMATDQPTAASKTHPWAAESWLEPWLTKHSEFYRKHLTRDGRRESKSTHRNSAVTEGLASRDNSVAAPEAGATEALPAPVGEATANNVEAQAPAETEAPSNKDKAIHNWRGRFGWLPHP